MPNDHLYNTANISHTVLTVFKQRTRIFLQESLTVASCSSVRVKYPTFHMFSVQQVQVSKARLHMFNQNLQGLSSVFLHTLYTTFYIQRFCLQFLNLTTSLVEHLGLTKEAVDDSLEMFPWFLEIFGSFLLLLK